MLERHKLPWLYPAPNNIHAELATSLDINRVIALSAYSLNLNQLFSLHQRFTKLKEAQGVTYFSSLRQIKIKIVSNGAFNLLEAAISGSGLRHGLDISFFPLIFDQLFQQAHDQSETFQTSDVILIALDYRGIPGLANSLNADENLAVTNAIDFISSICVNFSSKGSPKIIIQSLANPNLPLFGNADMIISGSLSRVIHRINAELANFSKEYGFYFFDIYSIANSVGTENWFDSTHWHNSKMPFSPSFFPLYGESLSRLISAIFGDIKKCLVLDLDNTLWGGVIGDDGIEGLSIGNGSGVGEAFLAIQEMALKLHDRGILLAVCSKNTEHVAKEPFQKHPDMLLKEEHISMFVANWNDKASNIKFIAQALNIGLDSLVFLDDNPVEREQVLQALPMVSVPNVSDNPSNYPSYIYNAGYFESFSFGEEDRQKTKLYKANIEFEASKANHSDLKEFLTSLNMEMSIKKFDSTGRSRIAQLISKSNQFNLTTKRYDENQIAQLESDPNAITLQIRLKDKFTDNGMISVVIAIIEGTTLQIDTWLMSCRVLNRRVEKAVLMEIIKIAKKLNLDEIVGVYIETKKNSIVKDHYLNLGFINDSHDKNKWRLLIKKISLDTDLPFCIENEYL
jgi:FkbH-like protein